MTVFGVVVFTLFTAIVGGVWGVLTVGGIVGVVGGIIVSGGFGYLIWSSFLLRDL